MQSIAITHVQTQQSVITPSVSLSERLERMIAKAEENRFGVVAALILLQVSIAGFNVVIPPMVGASTYLMAPGIFMAFLSNGLALAQVKMKWALAAFALSISINAAVSIYCAFYL